MGIVFKQLSILYIFLVIGWGVGKLKKDKAPHADILSILLVKVFLPCKVFSTFANNVTIEFISQKYILLIESVIALAVLVLLGIIIPKLLTKKPFERRVYSYSVPITNYAYLGYALIGPVFGDSVLADFMFFVIPFVVYTYTAGYTLLTGGKFSFKKLVNPLTIAIILGVTAGLTGIKIPDILNKVLSTSSNCVGPISMLLTGITLSTFTVKELFADGTSYIFSFIRLVAIPGIAFLVCKLLKLDALLPMLLIVTCMPCGLNPIVFPKLVGEDCKPGARLALITHILSLASLPLWLSLIL